MEELFGIENITINPIAIHLKPNRKARIIIDMLSPHLRKEELEAGIPAIGNSGIDKEE